MKIITGLLLLQLLLFFGCNKGLAPISVENLQKAGFSGSITFIGEWPSNVTRTHIIVFKNPISTAGDFNITNLAYISYEIPFGTSVFTYNTAEDSSFVPIGSGDYSYVVVAQSTTPVVSFNRADWTVVGVYYAGEDTTHPGKLVIPENTLVKNINITCNFNAPPPQPPGGK